MNVPEPLENEGTKPYAAFRAYVEMGDNRSTGKVARQLSKSRQLITRWSSKFRWQERIAAQRQRECEQKIAAEERAVEKVAEITEAERADVARRCFDVGRRCINRADEILEEHPMAAVRLLAVGADVVAQVGGAARGYATPTPPVHIEVVQQYVDANGNPTEAEIPPEPQTIEECDAIIAEYEAKHPQPEPLPCDDWSEHSPEATPTDPGVDPTGSSDPTARGKSGHRAGAKRTEPR
jgi:hypothetical protein